MKRHSLIKRFYGLLKETNRENYKETLVAAYSSKQSSSVKDLSDSELISLIDFLSVGSTKTKVLRDESSDRMRKKIIAICAGTFEMVKDGKVDMQRINKFVLEKGYLKKDLNDYLQKELPTLISQFENIQDWKTSQNVSKLKKSNE